MAKQKTSKKSSSQTHNRFTQIGILCIVCVVLIVIGLKAYLMLYRHLTTSFEPKMSVSRQIDESATLLAERPLPTVDFVDKGEMTTYSNSSFGFSMSYPTDLFVYRSQLFPDNQYWATDEVGGPFGLQEDDMWLLVTFKTDNSSMMDFYQRIIDAQPNTVLQDGYVRKYTNLDTNGVKGTIYGAEKPKEGSEPASGRIAVWIKGDVVYTLGLHSFSDATIQKNAALFDELVASFEFQE